MSARKSDSQYRATAKAIYKEWKLRKEELTPYLSVKPWHFRNDIGDPDHALYLNLGDLNDFICTIDPPLANRLFKKETIPASVATCKIKEIARHLSQLTQMIPVKLTWQNDEVGLAQTLEGVTGVDAFHFGFDSFAETIRYHCVGPYVHFAGYREYCALNLKELLPKYVLQRIWQEHRRKR